jgi:hypothetical protein
MRISLKQTILLSTALFTMNLSLSAMEATTDNGGVDKLKLAAASEASLANTTDLKSTDAEATPLSGAHLEAAKRFSRKFFGAEVEDSFSIFYKISELFNDQVKVEAAEATLIPEKQTNKSKGGGAKKAATPARQHETTSVVED